jgi:glucose/mannose transport system substrate-binding protein
MTSKTFDQTRRVQRALDYIEANLAGCIGIKETSEQAALSPWHFQRVFHEIIGVPVKHYVRRRRLSLATLDLLFTRKRIIDIAVDAGFESQEAFTRAFCAQFGMPPSRFRAQHRAAALPATQFRAVTAYQQPGYAPADDAIEVLHWWTSGGEARASGELQRRVEAKGYCWKDVAIPSYAGQPAMDLLTARAIAGKPPMAAQVIGHRIQDWGRAGVLTNLDEPAASGDWDALLPDPVRDLMQCGGHYVAAPLAIHRVNCVWVNLESSGRRGLTCRRPGRNSLPPREVRCAGVVPVSCGNQSWETALLFQGVALGVGGVDFYRKAFVELDAHALGSSPMAESLAVFRRVRQYAHPGSVEGGWDRTTRMVIEGEAAMQFMGDWARAEFSVAGKVPGRDYLCLPVPGSAQAFAFHVDSLVMFNQGSSSLLPAQSELCLSVMDAQLQEAFNLDKGSMPARRDLSSNRFEREGRSYMEDFVSSLSHRSLVPSWEMAMPGSTRQAFAEVLSRFWSASLSPDDVMHALVSAAKAPSQVVLAP